MEALTVRASRALLAAVILSLSTGLAHAASHRTANFIVTAQTKPLAMEIAQAAEHYRKQLAIEWLGEELPRWSDPCPIQAKVHPRLGAGGATSFLFETGGNPTQFRRPVGDGLFQAKPAGRPFGWEMSVQGSRERVLDSVLPHEVTHTIFATHFGRPLPRWADEGACTIVEHPVEKQKQHHMLYEFLQTGKGIAFNRMFAMTEYPDEILPLYAHGFSVARFFVNQGGKRRFVQYVGEGLNTNDWTAATRKYYGYKTLSELQLTWLEWVRSGSSDQIARQFYGSESPLLARNERSSAPESVTRLASHDRSAEGQRQQQTQSQDNSKSWYARQRDRAKETTAPPKPSLDSVASRSMSRPEPSQHQREVLIEWGQPSPFLAPRLAEGDQLKNARVR